MLPKLKNYSLPDTAKPTVSGIEAVRRRTRNNAETGEFELFTVNESGRVEFGRVDIPYEDYLVLPVADRLDWITRHLKTTEELLNTWDYHAPITATLTVSGFRGLQVPYTYHGSVTVMTFPFIQVSHTVSADSIFSTEGCILAKDLFGKFYWSLGVVRNPFAPER
jgi:hypothetical protein